MSAELPLVDIIGDFNNRLLSISAGYASFDYEPAGMRSVELVKIGIRLNGTPVDILSTVQPRERSLAVGRAWTKKLASLLPRQQFTIAIQAVIGPKTIIAREDISAVRKDVLAKCVNFPHR
jgi:GTP-binding protein LepA